MSKKLFLLTSFVLVLALACTNVSFGATIDSKIANGNDDVEERLARANEIDITSSDLEFPHEDAGMGDPQVIGLRFIDIAVPKGATITNASIQFKVDETKDGTLPVNLIIDGESAASAAAFTADAFTVTSRVRTTASVQWSVPNWTTVGDRGPDQATPNIAAVIQEIVNQDGWASGNALVLIISDDPANPSTGLRCAEAFEGDAPGAPLLHIEYTTEAAVEPPAPEPPAPEPPAPEPPAPEPQGPEVIWFEAEKADTIGTSWRIYDDRPRPFHRQTASGGAYIGSNKVDGNHNDTAPGAKWVAVYNFTAVGGDYKVVLRTISSNDVQDSFWVRIPSAISQTYEDPDQPGTGWVRFNNIDELPIWNWDEVHSDDNKDKVVNWTLPAGANTLEIAKREYGVFLDAIVITNNLELDQATLPDTVP
jgi:hypothetical protein